LSYGRERQKYNQHPSKREAETLSTISPGHF